MKIETKLEINDPMQGKNNFLTGYKGDSLKVSGCRCWLQTTANLLKR